MSNIYQHKQLQERQSASPALTSSTSAKSDVVLNNTTKLSVACRGEKTLNSGRTNVVKHSVFVLDVKGKVLEPANRSNVPNLRQRLLATPPFNSFLAFEFRCFRKLVKRFRRFMYNSNFQTGGIKDKYSCGTVLDLRKGLIIGTSRRRIGQLCEMDRGSLDIETVQIIDKQ